MRIRGAERRRLEMIYEVRFQTVDLARRDEYVKHYKQVIQDIK